MSKPYVHAVSSAKKFGGKPEDYLDLHNFLDSSKACIADHRHRILSHHSWFLSVVLERVFGVNLTNSDGKLVSVREVGEQHVLEDFGGVIPSAADWLAEVEYQEWMGGKGRPPSHRKIEQKQNSRPVSTRDITFD